MSNVLEQAIPDDLMYRWKKARIEHLKDRMKAYVLAPIAVLGYSDETKLSLTRWNWLETLDADLTGDHEWKARYPGKNLKHWWYRILWLWRNGAQRRTYLKHGIKSSFITRLFWHEGSYPDPDKTGGWFLLLAYHEQVVVGFYYKEVTPLPEWAQKIPFLKGRAHEVTKGWKLTGDPKKDPDSEERYYKITSNSRWPKLGDR